MSFRRKFLDLAGRVGPAGLAALLLGSNSLAAATFNWVRNSSGNASGSWASQANWSGGTLPTTTNDTAAFNALDITSDSTITLDGSKAINDLSFGDAASGTGASWVLNAGNPPSSTLTLGGPNPSISVTGLAVGEAAVINAVIAGTNGLTKTGTGFLQLNAANAYSGNTVLSGSDCRVSVGNDHAFGSGKVLVGANPGDGQVWFQPAGARTLTNDFEIRTIRWIIDWNGANGVAAGPMTVNGNILFNAGPANVRDIYCGENLTLNGSLTVTPLSNPFNKQGGSMLTLNGTNTFSGPTTLNGGTLAVNGAINSPGTVTINNGTTLTGTGFVSGPVSVQDGGTLAPGNDGSGTLTVGGLATTAGAVLSFGLGATNNPTNAFLHVNGDLTLAGVLKITDLGGFSSGTYTGIWYSGTLHDLGLVPSAVPNAKTIVVKTDTPHYVPFQVLGGVLFPAAGQGVPMDLANPLPLSWVQGPTAVAYDLYFGTSSNSVAGATTNSAGLYQGRTAALTGPMATLTPNSTYFWRVDSVAADGMVTAGSVLNFTTGAPMYDAMADTWVATDGSGRVLPGDVACGLPRTNRYVGIFYFLWQSPNSIGRGAGGDPAKWDVSRYLAAHPWTNPLNPWADNPYFQTQSAGTAWFWGQPAVDYYAANDPWVLRRNIALLSDAGVDVLIFDYSNAVTYDTALQALCSTIRQMRFEGFRTNLKIVFLTHAGSPQTASYLYNNFYSQNQFPDLWFYWQGKPLILGYPSQNGVSVSTTVSNFFTWRTSWANVGQLHDEWQWIDSATPQNWGYDTRADLPEELAVTCGGWSSSNLGHSYTNHTEPAYNSHDLPLTGTEGQGLFFQEQMFYGLKYDPQFLFITGWNEWIAGVWFASSFGNPYMLGQPCPAGGFYFVDEYNEEFSRDIEPMMGGHTDNYYFQMVGQNRLYKGARPVPTASSPRTINLAGDFGDWTNVAPPYYDPANDTLPRNFASAIFGQPALTNNTGRNDFTVLKVARDTNYLYFFAQCNSNLTSYTGSNWMVLFIDADQNHATGWEGYNYAVNLGGVGVASTTLFRNSTTNNGWIWTPMRSDIPYTVNGKQLMLRIARSDLGLGPDPVSFDFHWADNFQTNDIADFGVDGDSAPDRRFNYRYQTLSSQPETLAQDDFENGRQSWWGQTWSTGSKWSLTSSTSYSGSTCAVCNIANGDANSYLAAGRDTSPLSSFRLSFRYKLHYVVDAQNLAVQYLTANGWVTVREISRDQYYPSGQNWSYNERQDVWLLFTDARSNNGTNSQFFSPGFTFRINATQVTNSSQSVWVDDFLFTGVPVPTNHPPVLAAISNQVMLAGQTLTLTNTASDPDVPPQTLTFSLSRAPTNAKIDPSTGVFTWRPLIAQSPLVTSVQVGISDNGTPPLSATESFWVTVNQPVPPQFGAVSWTKGACELSIAGDPGPDYAIQGATNLIPPTAWVTLLATNSPPVPFRWADPQTNLAQRFYRVILGP